MTSISLNRRRAADILISKFLTFKLLYSFIRYLHQMIDYIN